MSRIFIWRKRRATSGRERKHEEVGRRTWIIRSFANDISYFRLATAPTADLNDRLTKRRYIIAAPFTVTVRSVLRSREIA